MAEEVADDAAEKERVKKQLMVLGVLLVLVVLANWKSIKKRFGGDDERGRSRGRRSRQVSSRGTKSNARRSSAPKRKAAPKAALRPDMIPTLDPETVRKIGEVTGKPKDVIPEDVIRYETRNPFIDLSLDDTEIMKKQDLEQEAQERGGLGPDGTVEAGPDRGGGPGSVTFRGVMPVEGERFVILNGSNRKIPMYLREGDRLPDSDMRLIRVGPLNAFVTLFNPSAQRTRDKVITVPRQGVSPGVLQLALKKLREEVGVPEDPKGRRRGGAFEAIVPAMLDLAERQERAAEAEEGGGDAGFLNPAPREETAPEPAPEREPEREPEARATPEDAAGDAPAASRGEGFDDFTFFDE